MKPLFALDAAILSVAAALIVGSFFLSEAHMSLAEEAAVVSGSAQIIDGDTLAIGGEKVRLWGIDTPEMCQPGYAEASAHLAQLITGSEVSCAAVGARSYGRLVARCGTAKVFDLAKSMVVDGYAVDWPKYSRGAYAADQVEAVRSNRGLWAAITPWHPALSHHVCK